MPQELDPNQKDQTPPPVPPADKPAPPSLDEVLKQLEAANAEKKALAEKVAASEKEKEEASKKTLEEKGEFKTLLEKERKEREAEKLEVAKRMKSMLGLQVRSKLEREGAEDVDNLMRLIDGYESKIKFDKDSMVVEAQSLGALIDDVKKSHARYFQKDIPSIKDGNPSNIKTEQPKTLRDALASIY